MIKIENPKNGADIDSVYCERGKEVYQEKMERVDGLEVKVNRVTNSTPFTLKVGESVVLPNHQAEWALKTFQFLKEIGRSVEEPVKEPEIIPTKNEDDFDSVENDVKTSDPSERFAELQIKGFANLKGAEREEYKTLKAQLTGK